MLCGVSCSWTSEKNPLLTWELAKNISMTCWLSGERSLPFGLLVSDLVRIHIVGFLMPYRGSYCLVNIINNYLAFLPVTFESHHVKTLFLHMLAKTKLCGNLTVDQRLCFRYIDTCSAIILLYPIFQASSHLLWLNSQVCVRPVLNPHDRFSRGAAH